MPSSTLFTDAMVLTSAGDGVYDGELNEHWTIGEKVHGGAMLALCANAARTEFAARRASSRSRCPETSCGRPDPGPMRVVTTVRKARSSRQPDRRRADAGRPDSRAGRGDVG